MLQQPTADDGVERLMLPVGVDFGFVRDGEELIRHVRRGAKVHDLEATEYAVWHLAHGSMDAMRLQTPWRRESVLASAATNGIVDASAIVDELLAQGLLEEVVPESDGARDFALRHRAVPLMLGLGNSSQNPGLFDIGFIGSPLLQVDFATYDLWQWSAMDDSLWDACLAAADAARRSNVVEPNYLEPDKLLTGFLRQLHPLLFSRAACVDVVFRLAHPRARAVRGAS